MKSIICSLGVFLTLSVAAQNDTVVSKVYVWNDLKVEKQDTRERRQIAEGSGATLAYMEWHATTIEPGKSPHAPHRHDDEEYIIIKEGKVKVTVNDSRPVSGQIWMCYVADQAPKYQEICIDYNIKSN